MDITTKYSVGDVVYAAEVNWDKRFIKCPDCLGAMAWEAKTPAGETLPIACPTCERGYEHTGTIDSWDVYGVTKQLTIGSVRVDTQHSEVEYMCRETGVGSGRVWKEDDLFATRAKAEVLIPFRVNEQKKARQDQDAKRYAHKKGNRAGAMTAYYRKEIRDAKKKLKEGQEGLKRQKGIEQEKVTA